MKTLIVPLLMLLCLHAFAAEKTPLPTAHTTRNIEGWNIRVDDRLLRGEGTAVGERALKLLAARLVAIAIIVPEPALAKLRAITIQLDQDYGDLRAMQYHPSAGWLKGKGYSEHLAKCAHIPDAEQFLSPFENHRMPWVVLHELAHAFHDQTIGFDDPRVIAVWKKFCDSGKYQSVLTSPGHMREHYGLTNQKEFFAEMTEAYFGSNDFYPFVTGELKQAEPETFALLAEIWGPLPEPLQTVVKTVKHIPALPAASAFAWMGVAHAEAMRLAQIARHALCRLQRMCVLRVNPEPQNLPMKQPASPITRRAFVAQSTGVLAAAAWMPELVAHAADAGGALHQAMGTRAGEVTDRSAIVWTRFTAAAVRNNAGKVIPGRVKGAKKDKPAEVSVPVEQLEGACPGAPGRVRLRYGTKADLSDALTTDWAEVTEETDFTHHFALTGLKPGTAYHYESETAGADGKSQGSFRGEFRTAPAADVPGDFQFCVMTCQGYPDRGHPDGHAIYLSMLALKPSFACLTGDLVYYDNDEPRATSPALARYHWQRMFSLPRLVEFNRHVGTYWLKDDHDTLNNDSWAGAKMGTLTFAEGQRIFRQQAPMGEGPGYRTFRWGRDLQIWLTEGRDFRSPNKMPDGPDKTIWGSGAEGVVPAHGEGERRDVEGARQPHAARRPRPRGQERQPQQRRIPPRGRRTSRVAEGECPGQFLRHLRRPPLAIPLRASYVGPARVQRRRGERPARRRHSRRGSALSPLPSCQRRLPLGEFQARRPQERDPFPAPRCGWERGL